MRIRQQAFSAQVELPCKIFCGPDSLLEIAATAIRISPASVHVHLKGLPRGRSKGWKPVVGEQLHVELVLPADQQVSGKADETEGNGHSAQGNPAGDRYLSVRGTVAEVIERPDGTQWLELRFRKPIFKERRRDRGVAVSGGAAPVKWTM